MKSAKGCFGLNAANSVLIIVLIMAAIGAIAYTAEAGPYYGMKDAEYARGGIRPSDPTITEFEMVMRIRNTQDITVTMPQTDFTVFFDGGDIGSGTIDGVRIPPRGTIPFPMYWDIPSSVNAGKLFEIQQGGKDLRIEMVMHASVFGQPTDIPITLEFGENEARVF